MAAASHCSREAAARMIFQPVNAVICAEDGVKSKGELIMGGDLHVFGCQAGPQNDGVGPVSDDPSK